ncbi:MAG: PAS domain-containing protein [Rhodocyclaceae bacterium]|nr:PAS domain-containing protein [Rhodocyclaceae bacterium]
MPVSPISFAIADDADFRRASRRLHIAIGVLALLVAAANVLQTGDVSRGIVPGAIALLADLSERVAQRDPRRALMLLTLGIWIAICIGMWWFAGVRSSSIALFPFLIAVSGWVMGRRWLIGLALVSLAYILGLGVAELVGFYVPRGPSTSLVFTLSALISIGITTLFTLAVFAAFERINGRLLEVTDSMLAHNAELAMRENDMEFLVNAMPVRMAIVDSELRVLLANASMLEMQGVTLDQVKGQSASIFLARNTSGQSPAAWEKVRRGEIANYLSTVEREPPERVMVHQVTLIPKLINGTIDLIIIVAQDISELYHANHAIQALNDTLELRVKERTEELAQTMIHLNSARKELVQSEAKATLGAMVASITHEMGTPLGNSLMTASTLRDQVNDFRQCVNAGQLRRSELEATLQGLTTGIELIERNLERASGLLKSFKQGAADQFTEQRREFDLAETVSEILTLVRPTLKKAAHQLNVDIPPGLVFDSYPGPLGQVFINLINNAWLHAFEGMNAGVLSISATPLADSPDQVRITIADNGIGMSEEVQAKMFEPFFSTKIGKGGTGLGMSIVEGIVRKTLGGTLQVDSAPGKGTRYTLTVPLRPVSV